MYTGQFVPWNPDQSGMLSTIGSGHSKDLFAHRSMR